MATPTKEGRKVLEGVIAINKPQWASSAGILRDLQAQFAKSSLFKPWLDSQRRDLITSSAKQKRIDRLKVKLGHGGTLDPMATGVLIVGVGKGTKCLQRFLECSKTYECVVLFGAATDSYDAVGKVVSTAPYEHVTKELVEGKLAQFRGKIMQKPSVFSALKVDGKKMYEYVREGKDIPEVAARPVEVIDMELLEWLEPGKHEYCWPKEEADAQQQEGAEKLLGIRKKDVMIHAQTAKRKRSKRSPSPRNDLASNAGRQPKKPKTDDEPVTLTAKDDALATETPQPEAPVSEIPAVAPEQPDTIAEPIPTNTEAPCTDSTPPLQPQPPAARIRMTVTSGFYVRSLCHDLGLACSSLGLMSSLVRLRQGSYVLGQNVLEYSDVEKGAEVWEPQVQKQLEEFMQHEGWEVEEIGDQEAWEASRKEARERRKEDDRYRSYRGGGGGGGKRNGNGGRNYYSKDMKGNKD